MKKTIIAAVAAAIIATTATVGVCASYVHNNMVDMSKVSDITATETGVLITTVSGDGYYWEK